MNRREFLYKSGGGLAGIIAARCCPAAIVRSSIGANSNIIEEPQVELPYDAEVEYIQQSNTEQYINTGIKPPAGCILRCDFRFTTISSFQASMCGHAYDVFGFFCGSNGYFQAACFSYYQLQPCDTEWHTYTVDESKTIARIDNGSAVRVQKHSTSTVPYCLFCRYRSDNMRDGKCNKAYCRSLYLGTSSQKLVDMIAVRFTNENGVSEGAMYDKVSKSLFRNRGSGSFIIGPDKA